MRKLALAFCIPALLGLSNGCAKADPAMESCGSFLAYTPMGAEWNYFGAWTAGFLTALNWRFAQGLFSSPEASMGWITDYCRSHPDRKFGIAVTFYALTMISNAGLAGPADKEMLDHK